MSQTQYKNKLILLIVASFNYCIIAPLILDDGSEPF